MQSIVHYQHPVAPPAFRVVAGVGVIAFYRDGIVLPAPVKQQPVVRALVPEHSAGLFAELDFELERLIGSGEIAEIAAAYIS